MAELMRFVVEHRPDLPTHFFAELWAAQPFRWRMLPEAQSWPCENKGDERRTGCRYKLDLIHPCWGGWEGTLDGGNRLVWIVQAADESVLEHAAPAAQLWPIKRGVNIVRWIEEGESPPIPQPPPLPGEGEQPGTPTPGPNPTPVPDLPPFDFRPSVITFAAARVTRPSAVMWGTFELVYIVPADWLDGLTDLALSLAERVQGVRIERKERG